MSASGFSTLLKYDFKFILHFSPNFVIFQTIYQSQKIWYRYKATTKCSITFYFFSKKEEMIL